MSPENRPARGPRSPRIALVSILSLACAACADTPARPAPAARVVAPPAPPAPPTEVFVYPAQGQDGRQLDRDRYECHLWAVRQSQFDPSLPGLPPHQRVRVVEAGPPPGSTVAAGAITGAVVGAAVGSPYDTGQGALVGAAAGAVLGAIAEGARADADRRQEQAAAADEAAAIAEQDRQAGGYRRAITACLEGRGYSVR